MAKEFTEKRQTEWNEEMSSTIRDLMNLILEANKKDDFILEYAIKDILQDHSPSDEGMAIKKLIIETFNEIDIECLNCEHKECDGCTGETVFE